jgi:preprotein translocase subunit YajC
MSSFSVFLAQVTNAADAAPVNPVDAAAQQRSPWFMILAYPILGIMFYYAFFRPSLQANKKKEETLKAAKTGDKIVTSSGIHGVITNVKDSTVIVRVADNVKLEIEKSHIEKINRPEGSDSDKTVAAKA